MSAMTFSSLKKTVLGLLTLAGLAFGFGYPAFHSDQAEGADFAGQSLQSDIKTLDSKTATTEATASSTGTLATATTPTPRFNFLQGDYEMLRGSRRTDTTWRDPVAPAIGEEVAVLFYYHNGIVGSVAHSTKLRVDLPMAQSTSLSLTSYLWSQETQAISDTIVNGQIVGRTGLTINTATPARVEYVPGTTFWYPEGAATGTQMPDGIVSSGGLLIGDVQGCWQYAGFVSFRVVVKGQAQMVMDKKVALSGSDAWQDEIQAYEGDEVAYKLGIRNEGNDTAKALTVKDQLPTYTSFVPGSVRLWPIDGSGPVTLPDTIFSSGVSIPDLIPGTGTTNVLYITYRVRIDNPIPTDYCGMYINNVARLYMNGVEQDMDQARVIVNCRISEMTVDKKVKSGTTWVEQNTATLGDEIEYKIVVKNTGNQALSGAYVRDVLPLFASYITGSTRIDGVVAPDSIITGTGLTLGSLNMNSQKVITFKAKIYGCPPVGDYTLQNTAYARAASVTEISDGASTVVSVDAPNTPSNQ